MAPEQRVLAMVQAGRITEEEAARLLAALRAHRRELPGWRVLITPMEFLSTRAAWTVATIATVASVLVARLGVRFDGALDLHRVSGAPPWSLVMVDAVNGILLTAVVLWLAILAVARSVRLIDFVLAVALARVAMVVGGIVAWIAMPRPDEIQAAMVRALTNASQVELRYALPGMLVAPFFVWFVVLLYQGFRTASGLQSFRAGVSFTVGIIAAEILSKLALIVAATALFSTVLLAQAPRYRAGDAPVAASASHLTMMTEEGGR